MARYLLLPSAFLLVTFFPQAGIGQETPPQSSPQPGPCPCAQKQSREVAAASVETTLTYICPLYYMGPAGTGLHLYYSAEWSPTGCGNNPQPLYLENPGWAGCATDPESDGHCIPASGSEFKTTQARRPKPDDHGWSKGHKITTFPPAIANGVDVEQEILESFTGSYEIDDGGQTRTLQIKFFKIKFTFDNNFWITGLGFEVPGGNFAKRNANEVGARSGKSFDAQIEYADESKLPYRVLLHRNSDPFGNGP